MVRRFEVRFGPLHAALVGPPLETDVDVARLSLGGELGWLRGRVVARPRLIEHVGVLDVELALQPAARPIRRGDLFTAYRVILPGTQPWLTAAPMPSPQRPADVWPMERLAIDWVGPVPGEDHMCLDLTFQTSRGPAAGLHPALSTFDSEDVLSG